MIPIITTDSGYNGLEKRKERRNTQNNPKVK
jgi:hypothetical protein